MSSAVNKYKSVSVESGLEGASPYQITKKLIDGCFIFLKQAKVAIEKKDYEKKSFFISKAEAVITTLASSLDSSKNEEVSTNLLSLYDYCLRELVDASVNMDADKVDSVISVFSNIKEGWDSISIEAINESERLRGEAD